MERVTSLDDAETTSPRRRCMGLLYGQCRVPEDFEQLELIESANIYFSLVHFMPTTQLL